MKVLYFASPFERASGGGKRSFEVLKRVRKYGVEPVIVTDRFVLHRYGYHALRCLGAKVYIIDRPEYSRYVSVLRGPSYAILRYHSIYCHSIPKASRVISNIARKEAVKFIVPHHEMIEYVIEASLSAETCKLPWTCVLQRPIIPQYFSTTYKKVKLLRGLYLRFLYQPLYRSIFEALKGTMALSVSPSIRLEMEACGYNGRIRDLNPGVGVEYEHIRLIEPSKEGYDATFFARLVPEKGIYDIPKIWLEIVKERPDAKLSVAGSFPSQDIKLKFFKMVNGYGLGSSIIYKGYLPRNTLYPLVKSSKVLVYPSKLDSFALVVLEALACGTPIVAYNIPALKLNYNATRAVKLVPIGDFKSIADETLKIIENDSVRNTLSAEATSFASRFSWDKVTKEEVKAYSQILP